VTVPHTLAEAWSVEAAEHSAPPDTLEYAVAQHLFYAGAAALLVMVSASRNIETIHNLLLVIQAELKEYLEEVEDA